MIQNPSPNVAVLLAAYNGDKYIKEQITSIIDQIEVNITIFISIDKSNDKTVEICNEFKNSHNNIFIINEGIYTFGSAGANFYFLIKNVNVNKFQYISFSDQDDIWSSDKIINGIKLLEKENSSGYSSNVECFWDNGEKPNIKTNKSFPQKKYDYYFEPAGPGCTYILKKELANVLKNAVHKLEKPPFHHDWFIYAFSRSKKYKWVIDNNSYIYYRQHNSNQVGANIGFLQNIKRLKKLKNLEFKKEYEEILLSIGIEKKTIPEIRKSIFKNPFIFRRRKKEAVLLFIFLILKWI